MADLPAEFARRFRSPATLLATAAGRVNLLGEHTDYNGGFVLPMAIDRRMRIALAPRHDRRVALASLDFGEEVEIDLDSIEARPGHWDDYARGVLQTLLNAGYSLRGWNGVLAGDIPVGAGLSSSAALGVAVARAALAAADATWDAARAALLVQHAENHWVGVQCGVMDQLASACGRAGHALFIDCRSLATELVPMPATARVVVLDTATRRQLGGDYNARRRECEAAAEALGLPSLRELPSEELDHALARLDAVAARRARHVVLENSRTLEGVAALRAGDLPGFGRLLDASHASLRDDFDVSTRELNAIVEIARALPGCFGARMTGAGFGGCAVALVAVDATDAFVASVSLAYASATGLTPQLYACQASDGATLVEL